MTWEYEPNVRVRHGAVLHQLLKREFGKDLNADLAVEIETYEKDVRRYEEQSGETLSASVKLSIIIGGMMNQKVRDHLELNAARLDTYEKLRDEVLNFAVARRTWNLDPFDDPMQVGALHDKGKGKGKGKKGKDGVPKAKAKTKAKAKGIICNYCKKSGHKRNECRKLKSDFDKGLVDMYGKPLPNAPQGPKTPVSARSLVDSLASPSQASSASALALQNAPTPGTTGIQSPLHGMYPIAMCYQTPQGLVPFNPVPEWSSGLNLQGMRAIHSPASSSTLPPRSATSSFLPSSALTTSLQGQSIPAPPKSSDVDVNPHNLRSPSPCSPGAQWTDYNSDGDI